MSQEHFDYLSGVAERLGVPDPFGGAATGRVDELRAAARAWRGAADRVESSTSDADARIGAIDAGWQGRGCDALVAQVRRGGGSGRDVAASMRALADGLVRAAEAVHAARTGLADLAADTADDVAAALARTDTDRARHLLDELAGSLRKSTESTEDALRDFRRLCTDLAGDPSGRLPAPAAPASDVAETPPGSGEPPPSELPAADAVGVLPIGVLGGAAPPRAGRRRSRSRAKTWDLLGGPGPDAAPEKVGETTPRASRVERTLNPPTAAPDSPAQRPVPAPDAGSVQGADSAPAGRPHR